MRTAALVAATAALALAGLAVPATAAEVPAPVYIEATAGEAALPGGMITVEGSVGAGCEQGKYSVHQEYWPEGAAATSTIYSYLQDDQPSIDDGQLVLGTGGAFSARVGVPPDATRSNLYGAGAGEVPHYLWVEVLGCETGAWKRASDRYGVSVAVQPLSMRAEVTTAQRTVKAGETLTVTAKRCTGTVATAWAEVAGTRIPSASSTEQDGTFTVTFPIPVNAGADDEATATVLCTQSQTPDNRNSVTFAVKAVVQATSGGAAGGGSTGTGTGTGTSGSTATAGTAATTAATGGTTATPAGATAGGTPVAVARAATPVSGAVSYAG